MEALSGYREGRLNLFKWRSSLSWRYKFALSIGFAGITGIAAQIMIILPWTPVPLTAQTFPVLVGAVLLGRSWGSVSQVLYVALGVLGVPWFFGMSGGYEHLLGASGGYLLGFIVAAWVIGYISDRYVLARRYTFMLMLFMVGMLIIYAMGLIQLYLWLYTFSGAPTTYELLAKGVLPFLPGDLMKVVFAATCAWAVVPKERFC